MMQPPLQLTFRGVAHSDALSALVRRRAEKLEHLTDRITSCHVVIDLASHRHRHGDRYRVSVSVCVPGHEFVAGHTPASEGTVENLHATADRAFDEAERQLEDWVTSRRVDRRTTQHHAT